MQNRFYPIVKVAFLAGIFFCGPASSETKAESVTFKANTLVEGDTTVTGNLTFPEGATGKVPAVLVIHSANGFNGHDRSVYIEALNNAGFATFDVNLFPQPGGRPKTSRMNLPHVFGSLIYLANHPRIDANRVGVTGYSWGGILSMFSASNETMQEFTGGKYRFAAHLPLYPVCWAQLATIEGKIPIYKPSVYQKLSGVPVHILAGDKDDYDDPDSCQKFVQALPESARQYVSLTVYPGAGHGWDTKIGRTYFDGAAFKGRGGQVRHYRNDDAAEKSVAFTVEFFRSTLKAK